MSSFSDAQKTVEIPIIAANLHRLILPRQSQIWAVLQADDSPQRLVYSLAATFLGRMCLSGDVEHLSGEQWQRVLDAQHLYRRAAPIIKHGKSRFEGEIGSSWRHPRGCQAVLRVASDGRNALMVLHAFAHALKQIPMALPEGNWEIEAELAASTSSAQISGQNLNCGIEGDFSARVVLLQRTSMSFSESRISDISDISDISAL